MAWRFPAGHAQMKELIAQCVESGVGIGRLPEDGTYNTFRFEPVAERPLYNGKPSSRGLLSAGARNPHKLKNWKPMKLSLNPMYDCPMVGDPWEFHAAKQAWHRGDPGPLRKWLAEHPPAKPETAEEPVQLDLAA